MNDFNLGDVQRLISNMVRVGKIAELDEANARVKVAVSGLTTDWLPWLSSRAGATRTWSAPRPGEQVVVLSPYGDTAQGVVLPSVYQDAHPAPSNTKDVDMVHYPDGATVSHDSASNQHAIDLPSGTILLRCGACTITITDSSIVLNAAGSTITMTGSGITLSAPMINLN